MNEVVKSLIKNNYLKAIDEGNFSDIYMDLYNRFFRDENFQYVGWFTETMLDAGINPLLYMGWVPPRYLYASKIIRHLIIPPHITRISSNAFAHSNIKCIEIPRNCSNIDREAFKWCGAKIQRY